MARLLMLIGFASVLAACESPRPRLSISSPALDSGITASGGGGTQSLGNNRDRVGVGVTTPTR